MYLFEAFYEDINTNEERKVTIYVEEQFFETEKDIYLCAMSIAIDKRRKNEIFSKLEFISC